jgi:hypothetical protein
MMQKLTVGSIVCMLLCLRGTAPGGGAQVPVPRGERRIVDPSPWNWGSITFNVMEHLIEPNPA